MKLAANVGSSRSWVVHVAADISDGEPTAETLAVRFANPESKFKLENWLLMKVSDSQLEDADEFKKAFEDAQVNNTAASSSAAAAEPSAAKAALTQNSEQTPAQDDQPVQPVVGKDEVELKKEADAAEAEAQTETKAEDDKPKSKSTTEEDPSAELNSLTLETNKTDS